MNRPLIAGMMCVSLAACGKVDHLGRAPSFTPTDQNDEHVAMLWPDLPLYVDNTRDADQASLWSAGQRSLLGDRRAMKKGDILTVVIEIDEEAEISNDTERERSASESLSIPQLLGFPQRTNAFPDGGGLADAVGIDSSSQSSGSGSVKPNRRASAPSSLSKVAAPIIIR
jgi:flagellar L-ring protein precursor FlgH